MSQITIDAALSQTLRELGSPAELRDPSGRVVGRFVPVLDLDEWEPVDPNEPEISDEELERRFKMEQRFTTAEVLTHLEKL